MRDKGERNKKKTKKKTRIMLQRYQCKKVNFDHQSISAKKKDENIRESHSKTPTN